MAVTQPGHRRALYGIPHCPAPNNRHSAELAHIECENFNLLHEIFFQLQNI